MPRSALKIRARRSSGICAFAIAFSLVIFFSFQSLKR